MTRVVPCLPGPVRKPGYHSLLKGDGFAVQDCVCHLVRESPASESRFRTHRVGVMLGGAFHYESDSGAALLGPGGILLGCAGGGYRFRHVDDGGDRSVTFDFSDRVLDEARYSLGSNARNGFGVPAIPTSRSTVAATVLTLQALRSNDPEIWEEAALLVAMTAVSTPGLGRKVGRHLPVTDADSRRIIRTMRHMESHYHQDCSLRALADGTGMSIYRFLRLFKILTWQTPRQYLLAIRLRVAATRLLETLVQVLEIAYGAGFGDISHFNQLFGATFGVTPTQFRRGRLRVPRKMALLSR